MSETCGKCGSKLVERKTSDSTDYCPVCEPRVVCEPRSCQNDPLLESIVLDGKRIRKGKFMNPMNGRAVREIVFKNGTSKVCCDFESMCIFNASHIDHDDDWVCVYRDGKEVERYNARYLLAIKWFIGTEPVSKSDEGETE